MCRGVICGSHPQLLEYMNDHERRCLTYERADTDDSLGFYVKEDGGRVYVSRVVAGSAADYMGLVAGQELLALNGMPCESKKTLVEVMTACRDIQLWVHAPVSASVDVAPDFRSFGKRMTRAFNGLLRGRVALLSH